MSKCGRHPICKSAFLTMLQLSPLATAVFRDDVLRFRLDLLLSDGARLAVPPIQSRCAKLVEVKQLYIT